MGNVHAVLIAANAVPGKAMVPAALDAADQMQAFLTARMTPSSSLVRLDGAKANRQQVTNALASARASFANDDLYVIMFSGHGADSSKGQAWVLNDGNFTDVQLAKLINGFQKAGVVVVADDGCFAARMFEPGPGDSDPTFKIRRREFLRRRAQARRKLISSVTIPVTFVLAAAATSLLVHASAGDTSEFVRTVIGATQVCNADSTIDHYGQLLDQMKTLVPDPEDQAEWSVQGKAPSPQKWQDPSPFRV